MKVKDIITTLVKLESVGYTGEVFIGDAKRKNASEFDIIPSGESDIILGKIILEPEYESVDMRKKYPKFGRRVVRYDPKIDSLYNTRKIEGVRYICSHITTFDIDTYTISITSKTKNDQTEYEWKIFGNVIYILLSKNEEDYRNTSIEFNVTFRYRED